jgi:hypothetical protein
MHPDYAVAVHGTRIRRRRLAALLAGTALAAALPRLAVPATLDLNGTDKTLPQAGFFGNQSYVNGTDGATNNGGAAARLI